MNKKTALAAALFACVATPALGQSIEANFTRVGPYESITAPFTLPSGVSSVNTYTGLVEVGVAGTGYSFGPTINDAFYFQGGGNTGSYYKLGIGTSANPLAASNSSPFAAQYIRFIDGTGFVAPGTTPTYSSQNFYRFVIDLGSLSTPLSFGVLDGQFSDNGGEFGLRIAQLRAGAVPEPGAWALLILGFGLVGSAMRRQRVATRRAAFAF